MFLGVGPRRAGDHANRYIDEAETRINRDGVRKNAPNIQKNFYTIVSEQ